MSFVFLLLILPFSLCAEVKSELSGNMEGQARHSWNNPDAKDLLQDWDDEAFYLAYGNLNGKIDFEKSRLEANWFIRYSRSELYDPAPNALGIDEPYLATRIFTFPNKLVARDIFQLQHEKLSGNHLTESVLNKFYYEWNHDRHRFMLGRMYVNYGLGEIFNPINPFNQPTGLTSISQVAQGNDGGSFTFFATDSHMIQFLLLGDKGINNYNGEIDWTLWAHGEYQYSEKLQLDYVLGKDQQRHKIGGQFMYHYEEAMIFFQILYQTEYINNDPSDNLWDILIGYDKQLNSLWHLRFEGGHQKRDQHLSLNSFGERFLPTEYFVALANIYEAHPLLKINLTIVNDVKSGFSYLITKATHDLGHDTEAEIFGYSPVSKGHSTSNMTQKLVTTDLGLALRVFF